MTDENVRPFVIGPGEGRKLRSPVGGNVTQLAFGDQSGGALTALETSAPPGEGPPLHVHVNEDEVIYVLEGELQVSLDGTVHEAAVGSFVFIPRGVAHTWQAVGDQSARFVFMFTPAAPGMEEFFARAAELTDDAGVAEAFKSFAADAGMNVVGPPLARSDRSGTDSK